MVIYFFSKETPDKQKMNVAYEMSHLLVKMNDTTAHRDLYYIIYVTIAKDPNPLFSSNERAAVVWVPGISQSDFKLFKIKDEDLPLTVCYDKTGKLCGFAKTPEDLEKLSCLTVKTSTTSAKIDKISDSQKETSIMSNVKAAKINEVRSNPCDHLPLKNVWWKDGATMKDNKIHEMDIYHKGDSARVMLYLFSNGSDSKETKELFKSCQSIVPKQAQKSPYYFVYASFGPNLQPVNQTSMNWARVNAKSVQASSFRNSNINPEDFPYVVVYNKDSSLCGCAKTPGELLALKCIKTQHEIALQGKLMTEKDQQRHVIAGADIFLLSVQNNDTLARTKSSPDGDFNLSAVGNTNGHKLVVKKQESIDNVILATRQGLEIGRFTAKGNSFEYKLLETEKSLLSAIAEDADVGVQLKQLKPGTMNNTVIQQISYGLNAYSLNENGKRVLDKIYDYLRANKNLKLEITSYTDAQGSTAENQLLSEKRSQAVFDYLVAKGLEKDRVKAIGKGESQIINHCGKGVSCSDQEHAVNRRTVFRFVPVN